MKTGHIINCPNCQHAFPIEAAFTTQLRGKIDAELRVAYDAQFVKERDALSRELTRTAQAEATRIHADRLTELEAAATEREATLKRLQTQLETTRREAGQRAREEFTAERKGLEEELARQRTALDDLRRNELELRREKTRLESLRHELEVHNARTLDAERVRLREELTRTLEAERTRVRQELASVHSEAQHLREAEHAEQTASLRRQVEELRRRLEAGGEQRRGELCEVRLEEYLRTTFPADTIEPVPRGYHGADVCQHVCVPGRPACGTIVYENKHTANWSPRWLGKLKEDQCGVRADVAVLVTAVLPKEVTTFALLDGVWVTSFACLPGLAMALRLNMIQLSAHRQAVVGHSEKKDLLYAYMTGDEFKRRVETLFEVISDMRHDLDKEKRVITASWARQETQLNRLMSCLSGFYGDMQGIAGAAALPTIEALEVSGFLDDYHDHNAEIRQATLA